MDSKNAWCSHFGPIPVHSAHSQVEQGRRDEGADGCGRGAQQVENRVEAGDRLCDKERRQHDAAPQQTALPVETCK